MLESMDAVHPTIDLDPRLVARFERLREIARSLGSAAVAFSGGIDSALVLRVLKDELGERVVAVTGRSPSFPPEEMEDARRIVAEIGARHVIVETEEIERRGYFENSPFRCAACKTELFEKVRPIAAREGLAWVCDGTNLDDAEASDRPGAEAARALGVRSPLCEAGLSKADVRAIARALGLSAWDKPAMACLSSRIPFGETITREKLEAVARAESALRALGFFGARVRHHGAIARIEVPAERIEEASRPEVRRSIVAGVRAAGFEFVALDLEGYRSGSLHRLVEKIRAAPRSRPAGPESPEAEP
jgi:uncharacterized protein